LALLSGAAYMLNRSSSTAALLRSGSRSGDSNTSGRSTVASASIASSDGSRATCRTFLLRSGGVLNDRLPLPRPPVGRAAGVGDAAIVSSA
jgi:hypothetical protein